MKTFDVSQACMDFPTLALLGSVVPHRSDLELIALMDWLRL
jgi:hypothetical protein